MLMLLAKTSAYLAQSDYGLANESLGNGGIGDGDGDGVGDGRDQRAEVDVEVAGCVARGAAAGRV